MHTHIQRIHISHANSTQQVFKHTLHSTLTGNMKMCLSKSDMAHQQAGANILRRHLRSRTRGSVAGRWGVRAVGRWQPSERSRVTQRAREGAGRRGGAPLARCGTVFTRPGAQGPRVWRAEPTGSGRGSRWHSKGGASATCTWRARPRGRNRKRLVVPIPTCSTYLEWVKWAGAR